MNEIYGINFKYENQELCYSRFVGLKKFIIYKYFNNYEAKYSEHVFDKQVIEKIKNYLEKNDSIDGFLIFNPFFCASYNQTVIELIISK